MMRNYALWNMEDENAQRNAKKCYIVMQRQKMQCHVRKLKIWECFLIAIVAIVKIEISKYEKISTENLTRNKVLIYNQH